MEFAPSADRKGAYTMDMVRKTLAQRLSIVVARLKEFDLRRSIGPFGRRVTQNLDGDGNEEVIYSESHFASGSPESRGAGARSGCACAQRNGATEARVLATIERLGQ